MRAIDQTGVAPGSKRCGRCLDVMPVASFYSDRSKRDGRHTMCITCVRGHQRAAYPMWRAEHGDAANAASRRDYLNSPRQVLRIAATNAVRRAPSDDPVDGRFLYDLWIRQRGRCALSGIVMTWGSGRRMPMATSISIDRIDRNRGYEKSNVRLLCNAINNFRGAMSDAELRTMLGAFHVYQFGCPVHALLSEAA